MNKIRKLPQTEFIILMALLTSLTALAIDAMLPAMSLMKSEFGIEQANQVQYVISVLFVGLSLGQLVYGPVSDSIGRKPSIFIGVFIFAIGSLISLISQSFEVMLIGRFLQGFGAAGPKIVTLALVRDEYSGNHMARIMSHIVMAFILVPAIAPAIGQGIMYFFSWRAIFGMFVLLSIIGLVWFAIRQPETLSEDKKVPLTMKYILSATRETLTNTISLHYMLAAGLVFGALISYITTAQQLFQEIYHVGDKFPLYFGSLALTIGSASFLNSKLVLKYGMRNICFTAMKLQVVLSGGFLLYITFLMPSPSIIVFMTFMGINFFCVGTLFGNLNSLSMEPLGHIAGVASATIGSIQTIISTALGFFVGQLFDGTIRPLIMSFFFFGLISLLIINHLKVGHVESNENSLKA